MNIWCLFLIATTLAVEISPKYVVEFHNAKISREKAGTYMSRYGRDVVLQRLEQADGVLEDGHFELLQGAGVYLCHVPYVNSTVSASEHLMETDMSQSDETIVRKALDILSESFSLQNCVFSRGFTGGYWTYAYCYGDKVIQYHENSELYITTGQRKPEHPNFVFILGRFEGSTFKKTKIENQLKEGSFAGLHPRDFSVNDDTINPFNQRNIHSTQKFLQHTINFGSICEETRERRSIDVIYKCDPLNNLGKIQIYDVNEIKTCQYQMVVSVPQLCALEEFQPTSLEEEVVEINCREVDAFDSGEILEATDSGKEYEEPQEGVSIEDFLSENGERPMFPRDLFPITNDYRISLSHYSLIPFGKGFFLAISRKPLETENVYFNQRHVLVYTKDIHSSEELVNEFGSMFQYAIGRKLLSPLVDVRTGYQNFLSWEDSFIMWFEMYDSLGYFNALIRVERKEEDFGILKLYFQIIPDPETMLDSDGDFVFIKLYDAPGGATNFEKYVPGAGSEFKVVTDVTEKPGIEEQERELKIKRDALATIQNVVKDKRERLKVVEDELSNGEGGSEAHEKLKLSIEELRKEIEKHKLDMESIKQQVRWEIHIQQGDEQQQLPHHQQYHKNLEKKDREDKAEEVENRDRLLENNEEEHINRHEEKDLEEHEVQQPQQQQSSDQQLDQPQQPQQPQHEQVQVQDPEIEVNPNVKTIYVQGPPPPENQVHDEL